MNWEEIFTSNNPAGGRMINVISGVAGSEASPYTADNPSGGRAINVNIVSGGAGAGVLQLQNNAPLDTTLRSVTDQANTVSPLQLSTTQVAVAASYTNTSTTVGGFVSTQTFAAAAGSANFRPFNWAYTINNSGAQSGTATGIFLNATETALNGMTHNLMDLQVGGVSRFKVSSSGNINAAYLLCTGVTVGANISVGNGNMYLSAPSDGVVTLKDSGTSFNRLQFGGTTNAFPAIRRNGAAIDFRLADDSGYANVNAARLALSGAALVGFINDVTNTVTAITIASTTGKTTFGGAINAAILPTTRPATVGDLYQDTAANILANGDKVVGIRQ